MISPLPEFAAAAAGVGLALVTPDGDGVVRRFTTRLAGQETLAQVVARLVQPERPPASSGLINYLGPSRTVDCVSYYQILDPDHPLPAARIRNRIVLIGRMLEASVAPQGQADMFYTPHYSLTGQMMAGVEIQAQIIHTLLSGAAIRIFPPRWRLTLYLVFLGLAGYAFARLRPLPGLVGLGLALSLVLGLSFYLFQRGWWVPPLWLSLGLVLTYGGNILWHYLLTAKEKRWLRQAFSRYVSGSLIDIITAHPERLSLGGEKVTATVLFADLAGFTSLSEKLMPEELIRLLNFYFSRMTEIILDCQGTLDKYIGDAIMAFWGGASTLEPTGEPGLPGGPGHGSGPGALAAGVAAPGPT